MTQLLRLLKSHCRQLIPNSCDLQPEVMEYALEKFKLFGHELSFVEELDWFLSEYDEGFIIPLQLGAQQSAPLPLILAPK